MMLLFTLLSKLVTTELVGYMLDNNTNQHFGCARCRREKGQIPTRNTPISPCWFLILLPESAPSCLGRYYRRALFPEGSDLSLRYFYAQPFYFRDFPICFFPNMRNMLKPTSWHFSVEPMSQIAPERLHILVGYHKTPNTFNSGKQNSLWGVTQ